MNSTTPIIFVLGSHLAV